MNQTVVGHILPEVTEQTKSPDNLQIEQENKRGYEERKSEVPGGERTVKLGTVLPLPRAIMGIYAHFR